MSQSDLQVISLDSNVSPAVVERWLQQQHEGSVTIQIPEPGVPSEGMFVPLLGWLSDLRRRGVRIEVDLPESEHADLRIASNSLLSALVLLHADIAHVGKTAIRAPHAVAAEQVASVDGRIVNAASVSFVTTNFTTESRFDAAKRPRLFDGGLAAVRSELRLVIEDLLQSANGSLSPNDEAQLAAIVVHAVENVRDHSYLAVDHSAIRGTRYVRFRLVDLAQPDASLPRPLTEYVRRAVGDAARTTFLEISVADPGRGIPATMSDDQIYEQPLGNERSRMTLALKPGGTCRPDEPGAGRGLVRLTRAVHELRGFMSFRTGRLSICRHYLDSLGRLEPSRFDERDPTFARTFDWSTETSARCTGTMVGVVVPLSASNS